MQRTTKSQAYKMNLTIEGGNEDESGPPPSLGPPSRPTASSDQPPSVVVWAVLAIGIALAGLISIVQYG